MMLGKVLKVASNDLYGNVDGRQVVVFAAFTHIRYMNKYVIFTFKGEYNKNKLYYGSLHLKNDSLVIFAVNDAALGPINTFINNYLDKYVNVNEYQMIDISNYNKVELISYSSMDFDKLDILDSLSIPKEEVVVSNNNKSSNNKKTLLYGLIGLFILLGVGATYVYLNIDKFFPSLRMIECSSSGHDNKINANYNSNVVVKFLADETAKEGKYSTVYTFLTELDYLNFKDNDMQFKYFNQNYNFIFNDSAKTLRVEYTLDNFDAGVNKVKEELRSEGYTCTEGVYRG